jgi:L-gulonolactone oxidase
VEANEYVKCYWFPHTQIASIFTANRTQAPRRPAPRWRRWRDESPIPSAVMHGLGALGRKIPAMIPSLMRMMGSGMGRSDVVDDSNSVLCTRRHLGFVGAEHSFARPILVDAFTRVRELIETEHLSVDLPVTLTVAAADDIPLSTAYGRETAYLGVYLSSPRPLAGFEAPVRRVEQAADELGARPHWGKLHLQRAATLAGRYPEWARFQAVRARLDPDGRFANAYLDRVLGTIG